MFSSTKFAVATKIIELNENNFIISSTGDNPFLTKYRKVKTE